MRRRAVFDSIREKARRDRSLELDDFRRITRQLFRRLQYGTHNQFVITSGFITPGTAKKQKVEAIGEDNGRAHAEYFEGLVRKPS